MKVNHIELENFRNFAHLSTSFDEHVNVILGDNAQGKTNLLESIYYLTTARSFRAKADKELISFYKSYASIGAELDSQGRRQNIQIRMAQGRPRSILVNGVKLKRVSELYGTLTAVLFCPDDLNIVRDGAVVRRRFMDVCISQLRPRYAKALSEFHRVYEQKTRILRDFRTKPSLLEALDAYDYRLAQMSAELIYYRASFSRKLADCSKKIHSEFSGGKERIDVVYKSIKTIDDFSKKPSELLPMILEHQKSHRRAELETGMCLTGAHKDDLQIEINGVSARRFASQGQTRTAALSLKLAEREIHYEDRGEYPVLLLDDVLSELDPERQNFVLNKIRNGQVFITCCESGQIVSKTGGLVLQIRKGEIV